MQRFYILRIFQKLIFMYNPQNEMLAEFISNGIKIKNEAYYKS